MQPTWIEMEKQKRVIENGQITIEDDKREEKSKVFRSEGEYKSLAC